MRNTSRVLAAAVVALSVSTAAVAADVIKERQEGFKANVESMKAIKAAVEAGDTAPIAAEAGKIAAFASRIPDLFPEGSQGDSRAKDEVWTDWNGFVAAAEANAEAAEDLVAVAQTGDAGAAGAQLQALGKTCGACHDDYRVPKD